jgi:hypothetical protein
VEGGLIDAQAGPGPVVRRQRARRERHRIGRAIRVDPELVVPLGHDPVWRDLVVAALARQAWQVQRLRNGIGCRRRGDARRDGNTQGRAPNLFEHEVSAVLFAECRP